MTRRLAPWLLEAAGSLLPFAAVVSDKVMCFGPDEFISEGNLPK